MKKRIVSAILILALILSVCCIGTVGAFAAEDSAVVRVGGKSYGAKVGDILEYRISFTYPGKNLSTAQVELPFDFDGLSSYTQDELKTHQSRIAPTTGSASVVQRFDTPGTTGIKGYVMNFVSVNGYSFTTEKRVLSLIFTIEKAGTYDFTSKVRYIEDAAGKTVVDSNYQVKDSSFKYTEAIYQATLDTPKLSASTAAGGIRVKWDPVPGASLYRVYYKGSNGWTKLTDTSSTSAYDDDVTSGTTYTYTIRAMDNSGNHLSWYYEDGFKITFIKAPVFDLSNAADGVRISWNAVPGAENYRVFYYGSRGWTRLADNITETSFIDTDVSSNHNYTYTVRCITADGSAYTSDFRAGKSIRYYAAPILKLSNAEDGVSIKWDAVAGASKYRVYYKGRNGWTKLTDTTSTSVLDEDVASGTNYTYTIRAMDNNNNHLSWYSEDGFKIRFIRAPQVTLSNAADGVKISWNKVGGAQKYRVFYYGSKGWTRLADTAETSFIDTDVSSNHNYTYTVRCITEDGSAYTSDYRAGKSIRYYAAPVLTLSNAANGVSINWNAVSGASQYRIYVKNANGGWTKLGDTKTTSYVDTTAKSGSSYTYTARAMDSSGNHLSWYYEDGFTITYQK